jgi:hypothetical protein
MSCTEERLVAYFHNPFKNAYKFCKRQIYRCQYTVSGYRSNELSIVNSLHERKLCSSPERVCNLLFQCIMSIL